MHLTLTLNLHTNEYWHRTHKAAMIRYIRVCKRKWVRRMGSSSSSTSSFYSSLSSFIGIIMFICSQAASAHSLIVLLLTPANLLKNVPLQRIFVFSLETCSLVRGSRHSGRIIYYLSADTICMGDHENSGFIQILIPKPNNNLHVCGSCANLATYCVDF